MRFTVSEEVDSSCWNAKVLAAGGPVQLTAEWTKFVAAKDGSEPLYVDGGTSDDPVLAVVYLARSVLWPVARWPTASAECLPLARDSMAAVTALEQMLRERRCSEVTLNSYAATEAVPLHRIGYTETRRLEFELSLSSGVESTWRGFRATLRQRLRQFEKSRCTCRIRTDDEALAAFCAIEAETFERHRRLGKIYQPTREETFSLLWTTVLNSGRARAYFAEKEGRPVAGAIVGSYGDRAYYLYGGATQLGLSVQAPKGLLWFAIQREYERGVRRFNLGGMSQDAVQPDSVDYGLYEFKRGFGASERVCISGHKILIPWVTGMRGIAARLRRFVSRPRPESCSDGRLSRASR